MHGPPPQGLYTGRHEHDACGVAFVATLTGQPSHEIIDHAFTALRNLRHRGASGSEPDSGDGAGILVQIPDEFLRAVVDFDLPPAGQYAVGLVFWPDDDAAERAERGRIECLAAEERLEVLGWRDVPVVPELLGASARQVMPRIRQVFVRGTAGERGITLDRRAYRLRKRAEHGAATDTGPTAVSRGRQNGGSGEGRGTSSSGTYFPSLSARTLVYKGMLTPEQLEPFFPDFRDRRFASALAVVHSRFSTNTFPSWPLAHPYRIIAHNGEINTVMGNRNWMRAREATLATPHIPGDLEDLFPILTPGASDSASFDEALELLTLGGYELPHAVLMMIPEAWENDTRMDPSRRAFYAYHASLMEAWDGPASITFTDGSLVGAVLDRNGLRPGRFWVMDDGLVVLASETGVLAIDPARVVRKGRLQPGRMFLVDLAAGRIIEDDEIKARLAAARPYQAWLETRLTPLPRDECAVRSIGSSERHIHLAADGVNGTFTRTARQPGGSAPRPEQPRARRAVVASGPALLHQQRLFGYSEEELRLLLAPMARDGVEPIGSMGTDTPLAVLSERPRLLFDYFAQLFAQVTNPPLDAIREELVTSLQVRLGRQDNLLIPGPDACRQVVLPYPALDSADVAALRQLPDFRTYTIHGTYSVVGGGAALRRRLDEVCAQANAAIENGAATLIVSDRGADADHAPIPSLLLTGAVHHHLVREKKRTKVGLVVESGDAREVHHIALLLGYGANAVHPYVALDSAAELAAEGRLESSTARSEPAARPWPNSDLARRNLVKAYAKGVLKVMSKMGVSTVASYTGAQIFEALGLGTDVVDAYFTGTTSRLAGVGLDEIAEEARRRHRRAYGPMPPHRRLDVGGEYQWRREGEPHLFDPETVFRLQHATRSRRYEIFKQYTQRVDEQSAGLMTLRGLFQLREGVRPPVPVGEVEPASEIVKRFNTGAMSYGSISREAHETIAVAMNRLGGRSNTGEGGEEPDRLHDPERRSAVKQVASGRFGVTAEYLTHASDLQIKMAQGAKPGEGGQLPGHKVYPWIAKTRYSTPGVGLISPPPHHDIYSIEDLAQLIHDLKNSNPAARIHVKLVAEVGVGTVAAGVAKAHADVVLISGHDGGTGASPLTSIKHAGAPWELGLAETQQTLLLNGLRDRVVVQTDGQLKTGRDVIVAALLGAEEFGFATAPLVVSGCVMMRVCHLDTCPVGIATQNPQLRERFTGKPEFVQTFFEYVAEEVREYLAALGFRSIAEAVGRAELLETARAVDHWKAAGLNLGPILHVPALAEDVPRRCVTVQDHSLARALDHQLVTLAGPALDGGEPVRAQLPIANVNRTVGTMLGHQVVKRHAGRGLPDETIDLTFIGSAGQSFGAFLPPGITLRLEGDANDYLAKGLSGGRVVARPDRSARFAAEDNVIAGNVAAYGATGGELYVRGLVGERFCVRNSGATAVTEGVGDHGCEYMTGGLVVVLGPVGRNFAAGMSGGVAYVLDLDPAQVNQEMVELQELAVGERPAGPTVGTDERELRVAVKRHLEETDSVVAAALLADWPAAARRFTKVMPADFKRVLAARAAAERDGLSDEAVTELMMEAAHG